MAKNYSESWRGRALRHFLVIVTQHFEANRTMAARPSRRIHLCLGSPGVAPAPVWKYLT